MESLKVNIDARVKAKFEMYPANIRPKLDFLRSLILETVQEINRIEVIEETLKWGEPSYLVNKGSTIRIDWKAKRPNQYTIYFKCTSRLVPTFKELFGDTFNYEKNRAIWFELEETVPVNELKTCIKLALNYHLLKHLPKLGE